MLWSWFTRLCGTCICVYVVEGRSYNSRQNVAVWAHRYGRCVPGHLKNLRIFQGRWDNWCSGFVHNEAVTAKEANRYATSASVHHVASYSAAEWGSSLGHRSNGG